MSLECPKCGSRNLRYSRFREFYERLWSWAGVRPLRCRDCRERFVDRTWRLSGLLYARCPRCWRMDLSLWQTDNVHVHWTLLLLVRLGAMPYRCEYCRVNFASFRQRLEKFSFRRWSGRAANRPTGPGLPGPIDVE